MSHYPDDASCSKIPLAPRHRARMFVTTLIGDDGDAAEQAMRTAVKPMCDACPVKKECLADAIRTGSLGVWAATTTRERKALRGKQAA